MSVVFVTGIDTDTGKSFAVGMMARFLLQNGCDMITQKMVQTGCDDTSEDIQTHRTLMRCKLNRDDITGLTCPQMFAFPGSPHLAAELEGTEVDMGAIELAVDTLDAKYEVVLLEGSGGLCVPLKRDLLIADWLEQRQYPVIVVSSGKLGSINHTLLTLEVAAKRNIPVAGIVYNYYPEEERQIVNDSKTIFRHYLKKLDFPEAIVDLPVIEDIHNLPEVDFSEIFEGII